MVQPMEGFTDPPLLIEIPKTGEPGQEPEAWGAKPFTRTANLLRKAGNGSLIQGVLKTYAPEVTPRRIALVGFSAGNAFLKNLLGYAPDANLLDAVVSLDGPQGSKDWQGKIQPAGIFEWERMARRATGMDRFGSQSPYAGPLMVIATTNIVPTSAGVAGTSPTTMAILDRLSPLYNAALPRVSAGDKLLQAKHQQRVLDGLKAALQVDVSINCGGETKAFSPSLPLGGGGTVPWTARIGNLWVLSFEGMRGPDHCFVAWVAQRAIFQAMLQPRWNARALSGLEVAWTAPDGKPGGGVLREAAPNYRGLTLAGAAAFLGAFLLGRA